MFRAHMIKNRLDSNLDFTENDLNICSSWIKLYILTNWKAVFFCVRDVKSVSCGHYELPLYGNELVWKKSFF